VESGNKVAQTRFIELHLLLHLGTLILPSTGLQLFTSRFALPSSRCDANAVASSSVSSFSKVDFDLAAVSPFDKVNSDVAAIHPITFKVPNPPPSSTRPSVVPGAPLPPTTLLRKRWSRTREAAPLRTCSRTR